MIQIMAKSKSDLFKEITAVLERPHVNDYYKKYLENQVQGNTIDEIQHGIESGLITQYEGLCLTFIIAFQWNIKNIWP